MKMSPQLKRATAVIAVAAGLLLGASVQAKDTIKIGFIGPLSGGNAYNGEGARNGFLLALQQANQSDFPYKVEAVVLDDAADPAVGVSAALKLVNDKDVVAATGHWNSAVALATIPVFSRNKMPFIVWGAISPKITEMNVPEVTRVVPTLSAENIPLAKWAVKTKGMKTFAIVSDTSDYGANNTKAFTELVTAAGGKVVSADSAPVGTTDFLAILTKIRVAKPDAVYFGGVVTEAALVRKQMADVGMGKTPMLGISGIFDEKFTELTGRSGDGAIASITKIRDNAKQAAFSQAYDKAGFKEPAGSYGKFAYDAANILLTAIKQNGAKDKVKLAKAIRGMDYQGVLGRTQFDANGQTRLEIDADRHIVKDGKWAELAD